MKPLPSHDLHLVRAAEGWLTLGCVEEAQAELRQLSPEFERHPLVMDVQWSAFAAGENWEPAHALASLMVELHPELVSGWIHRSYAARRMPAGGLKTALEFLLPAAERFPAEPMVAFNLACYLAQAGALEEAWGWYREALRRGDPTWLRARALEDEDLGPLWSRIRAGEDRE